MAKLKKYEVLSWQVRDAGDAPIANTPALLAEQLKDIASADREHFVVLALSARMRVVARETVSIGTLTASLVHPREVFKSAIMSNAAAIVVAHNHPSGDPEPSREDGEVTSRLRRAGEILGIQLLDHIVVVADGKFVSFKERGLV